MDYNLGPGLASLGTSIADAMEEYHKRHVGYDQQMKLAEALANIGITPDGKISPLTSPDVNGKPQKIEGVQPVMDKKALEMFKTTNQSDWDKNTGGLKVLNQLAAHTIQARMGQMIQDASLSGQRTKQIIDQATQQFPIEQEGLKARTAISQQNLEQGRQSFPLEQEGLKARTAASQQSLEESKQAFPLEQEQRRVSTAHIKKLTDDEGKIDVPGYGKMTPAQLSAHKSRMDRLANLTKKLDPITGFENQLQSAYGLGIKDIVDAAKPQQFLGNKGKDKYVGTPFYDVSGQQIPSDQAFKKPGEAFVMAGANRVPIPLLTKGGLGWQQIVPKAKNLAKQMDAIGKEQTTLNQQSQLQQAQQIMAVIKAKDQSTLTPQDQAALQWAQGIIGQ